ncbi:hypothetical protein [Clostridium amazonitimonense]|uniref:hypothetical protein n=1 Tax=Clostridium amazonitimonense TaxID=1499689 RepID=UPI000509A871|nr:hypothetical protein [Clostridium amazonitimonense]
MLCSKQRIKKSNKGNILLGTLLTMTMVFTISVFILNMLNERVNTNRLIYKRVLRENSKAKEILLTRFKAELQSSLDKQLEESADVEINEVELLRPFTKSIIYEDCSINYDGFNKYIKLKIRDFNGVYCYEYYKYNIEENNVNLVKY